MKELSIEDKAKAYDKALKVIKDNLDALNEIAETGAKIVNIQTIKNCFHRAFPELKESEDEKIRKAIHIYFDWLDGRKDYQPKGEYTIRDMIAWLEKQGEQKLQIEKLPFEMKTIGESLGFTTQEECDKYNQMVSDLIMYGDDKGEKKLAWSEEDECYMSECIGAIATKDGWSFEEKRKTKHWLKSLKDRYTWKPSDEQIVVLELASKYERVFTPKQIDILIGLKEQLKKLKGE